MFLEQPIRTFVFENHLRMFFVDSHVLLLQKMDAVYMIHYRRWISAPVCIKDYFATFKEKFHMYDEVEKKSEMVAMMDLMGTEFTENEYMELENYCCTRKLSIPNECMTVNPDPSRKRGVSDDYKLASGEDCLLKTVQHVKKASSSDTRQAWKYTSTIWLNNSTDGVPDLKPNECTLLIIRVYEPFKYILGQRCTKTIHCMYEIAVLGHQTLAEFRDRIVCTSDMAEQGDLSENPDRPITRVAKDVYKSGFLFIEDVFYNDFRDPNNRDYSATIRKWAKEKNLGPFSTGDMAATKFEDLTVRFGYPYVFQHQGKCEHLIVFSDARLIHQSDVLVKSQYPLYVSLGAKKTRYCLVCNLYVARWVTRGNDEVYIDPCYFCDKCFKMCNYKDGKKVGNFTAYRYYDKACIL